MVCRKLFGRMCFTRKTVDRYQRKFIYQVAQTCNFAYLSSGHAFDSETSGMCAQAVAYQVEIPPSCTQVRHEAINQIRYVPSSHTCIRNSSNVVRSCGQRSPIDADDVEIASRQISWKENSTWF
jgi:hypothetical protein